MKIVYSEDHLHPKEFGFDLGHLPIWLPLEIAVERSAIDVLHDQKDLLVALEGFIQLGEAFMVYLFHNFDFSFHALSAVGLKKFEFFVNFDSNFLIE